MRAAEVLIRQGTAKTPGDFDEICPSENRLVGVVALVGTDRTDRTDPRARIGAALAQRSR
jgi:hypothetical protein